MQSERLARSSRVNLPSKHDGLELVVNGQDTSAGDTPKDVGSSTLEQGFHAFLCHDLASSIDPRLVMYSGPRGHHHATSKGVERVRGDTGTSRNRPTKREGGEEGPFKRPNQDSRFQGVVDTEICASVYHDADNGGNKPAIKSLDTVCLEGLLIHIKQPIELSFSARSSRFSIATETGTRIIQRVNKERGCSAGASTRSNVSTEPALKGSKNTG